MKQKCDILKLYYARHKKIFEDLFDSFEWSGSGDWHKMTIDTNADKSSGLIGGLALNSAGCYAGGEMTKTVELDTWGEVIFEHYVQNPDVLQSANELIFYVDGVKKLRVEGPSPWQRCSPIGISPGEHELKFEYNVGTPNERKGVIDTLIIHEAKKVDGLIGEYKPPTPVGEVQRHTILRNFTRQQQMKKYDSKISFQLMLDALQYQDFMTKSDGIFYFVDEFNKCYRGTFDNIEPKSIAVGNFYSLDLVLTCPQKAGVAFV